MIKDCVNKMKFVNVNDIAFMVRMENLVEKLFKSQDKKSEEIVEYFVDY